MSTINSNLLIGKKDNAFFIANPTLVLLDGQLIYNEDTGDLFIGDGVTQLSALTAINGSLPAGVLFNTDIGVTVQGYDANTTILGNSTSANQIVLTDGSNNLSSLGLGANQSIRRNSANTAYEAFVPLTETSTNTLTNKRITARASTEVSSATPTINTDNVDYYSITALATNITSFTTNLSGTPTIGQTLWISITDNAVARTIAWGASFQSSGNITLPTTTIVSTRLDVAFIWNEAASVWRCVGVA